MIMTCCPLGELESSTQNKSQPLIGSFCSHCKEALVQKATPLAEFWEVPLDELVQGLRHMFALRDACLARDDDLRRGRSLDLWLMVLRQTASGGELHPAAAKILHSFLITQTQSAGCERTFARIEEIKHLWLRQFSSFCIAARCGFLSVSFEPDSMQPFQHGPRNHMSDAPPPLLEQILLIGAGPSPLDALQGDLLSRCLNVFMQKERRMSTSEFVRKKGKLVQRRRAMRSTFAKSQGRKGLPGCCKRLQL